MRTSIDWSQIHKEAGAIGLDDMRRNSLLEIGIVLMVCGWLILLSALGFQGRVEALPVAFLLFGGAFGIFGLRKKRLSAALIVFIASAIAAIACAKILFPAGVAQFFYPVVIVACGALLSGWHVLGVAGLTSLAVLVVARWQGAAWFDSAQVTVPVVLCFLTAFAAWLGSRQMHIALAWMQNSYKRSSELLEQLRDERQQLALTVKMLEDAHYRITKLNYNLIEARSAAEQARRLKAEFAANISHELRTPLNLIIGYSETMANVPETYRGVRWTPTLRGDVEQIYRSSKHLSDLIDDILDLSALEAQQLGLTVEETDIRAVIEEAVGVIHDLYRVKNLYLQVQCEPDLPRVRLDPVRIRQVLLNILTNATRFTPRGGVTIRAQRAKNMIQVSVTDTGIGIAADDFARVFAEFGQVDGTSSRKHEGTGLGIPLSKRLVELHGGHLWLESQLGIGTTFFFTIPILPEQQRQQSKTGSGALSPQNAMPTYRNVILAVESDALLLRTIRRHMSAYDVMEVKAGQDVRALVEYHQPLALLLDTAQSQALPAWVEELPRDLPIISVSLPGSLKSAQALGIENYLVKPVLREQLLDTLARVQTPIHSILIVDDDPALVELLSRMLESSGQDYELRIAYQGLEALAILMQQRMDLVLLDMVMPELGGVDVLFAMKQDAALADIPVIIISGQPREEISLETGLFLQVTRAQDTSLPQVLACLKALVEGLPPRELASANAPLLPTIPVGLPVS